MYKMYKMYKMYLLESHRYHFVPKQAYAVVCKTVAGKIVNNLESTVNVHADNCLFPASVCNVKCFHHKLLNEA